MAHESWLLFLISCCCCCCCSCCCCCCCRAGRRWTCFISFTRGHEPNHHHWTENFRSVAWGTQFFVLNHLSSVWVWIAVWCHAERKAPFGIWYKCHHFSPQASWCYNKSCIHARISTRCSLTIHLMFIFHLGKYHQESPESPLHDLSCIFFGSSRAIRARLHPLGVSNTLVGRWFTGPLPRGGWALVLRKLSTGVPASNLGRSTLAHQPVADRSIANVSSRARWSRVPQRKERLPSFFWVSKNWRKYQQGGCSEKS